MSDWLNIVYRTEQDAEFELFDLHGRRVAQVKLYHYFKNRLLRVRNLPAGAYSYTVKEKQQKISGGKVVIIH